MGKCRSLVAVGCAVLAGCTHAQSGIVLANADLESVGRAKVSELGSGIGTGGDTFRFIAFDYWICEVKWNQACGGTETVTATSGWQVCKPIWGRPPGKVEAGKGGPTWRVTMNDYSTVSYLMYVRGSGKAWDKWGSSVKVYDIGMKLIRAPATPAQRQAAGCVDPGVVTDGS